jgi:hypothetical protein
LREELRGNEQAASREQAVIRASLAGLKGSERDRTGARNLFKLFGLVPEDTSCPLECLQLMYDAVYEPDRSTSVLHIRKWLKMLIDRSLVLGTVDRASLHDLVLDFTVGMYEKADLITAHRRVVEAFRVSRVVTAAGIPGWELENGGDPMTAYVVDQGAHHVTSSRDPNDASSDDVLLSWLVDQPADALVSHVGAVLGEHTLLAAAEESVSDGKLWLAACRLAAAAEVMFKNRGAADYVPLLKRVYDMLSKLRASSSAVETSSTAMDHLELSCVSQLIMYDPTQMAVYAPPHERLLATAAGKGRPDRLMNYWIVYRQCGACFTGDRKIARAATQEFLQWLVREGCENQPDWPMREFLCTALGWFEYWGGMELMLTETDWWSIFGRDGEHAVMGVKAYKYNRHHFKSTQVINTDYALILGPSVHVMALHYGDLAITSLAMDNMVEASERALLEPLQSPEQLGRMCASAYHWPYLLGYSRKYIKVLHENAGDSWSAIEESLDHAATDLVSIVSSSALSLWPSFLCVILSNESYVVCSRGMRREASRSLMAV